MTGADRNGAEPSIEEVLAAIRRVIRNGTPSPSHHEPSYPSPTRDGVKVDDASFELPALFRSTSDRKDGDRQHGLEQFSQAGSSLQAPGGVHGTDHLPRLIERSIGTATEDAVE